MKAKNMTPLDRVLLFRFRSKLTPQEEGALIKAFEDTEDHAMQKENAVCAAICDDYARRKSDESKGKSPATSLMITGECAASEYLGSKIRDRIRKQIK